MLESTGHEAGFAANAVSVHAFWIVGIKRAGSCLGSVTATLLVFACPAPLMYLTSRLAPCALLVFACVETVNDGLNARFAQSAAWKRLDTFALAPWVLVIVPATDRGSQLVGLNMKCSRSTVTLTVLICRGMPCRIVGNGSLTIVTCAVCGSIASAERTTTGWPSSSRSNGPATAGTATLKPNGAPLYGPVKNTWPETVTGSGPAPACTVTCPIKLPAPHVPRLACGSGQRSTPFRSAESRGGVLTVRPARFCSWS